MSDSSNLAIWVVGEAIGLVIAYLVLASVVSKGRENGSE